MDQELSHGEIEMTWCRGCRQFSPASTWEPIMATCNLGTEHFGEKCARCGTINVVLAPHELRPEPDANLADPGDE